MRPIIVLLIAFLLLAGVAVGEGYITIKKEAFTTDELGYLTADRGTEYLVVHVGVENHGVDEFETNPYRFKAEVTNVEYDIDSGTYFLPDEYPTLQNVKLKNGGKIDGYIVFKIPKGEKSYILTYPLYFWESYEINYESF